MNIGFRCATCCVGLLLAASLAAAEQPRTKIGIKGGVCLTSLATEETGWVATVRGYNFVSDYTDSFNAGVRTGLQIGEFISFDLKDNLSFQVEMMYAEKGVEVEGVGTYDLDGSFSTHQLHEKIKLTYLQVPVLIKYRIPKQGKITPSLFAGPALAFNRSASDDITLTATTGVPGSETSRTTTGETTITNIRSSDLSLVFGGDLSIAAGAASLVLDIRYELGLSEPFEDISGDKVPYIDHAAEVFPEEYPMAARFTGRAPEMKNRAFSITLGIAVPM